METRDQKENWKKALGEASVDPSLSVWEGVELQLDKLEVTKLRSTVVFYKWLAAACVTAAVVAMSFSYYVADKKQVLTEDAKFFSEKKRESDSESTKTGSTLANISSLSTNSLNDSNEGVGSTPIASERSINNKNELSVHSTTAQQERATDVYGTSLKGNTFSNTLPFTWRGNVFGSAVGLTQQQNTAISSNEAATIPSPLKKEEDENAVTVALLDKEQDEEDTKPTNRQQEKFWTSIGFSAGTFANTTPTSATTTSSALRSLSAGQTAASESNSPGYTYAVNLAVGTKVSKRWLIQGGMSYIAQLSDYTATSVVTNQGDQQTFMAASINQFEKNSDNSNSGDEILSSTPYQVNNNIQLISFPVQAGYMVVDRKLAFQVNSGISTDLFMQNTITPEAANLEKTTQGRGDDSPYRPVNFSGLVGTELSYRFGENYRISLSPGLRYPFNSIYKTNLGIKSSPLTFDVAVRFRYILK